MRKRIQELKEKRAKLVVDARALIDKDAPTPEDGAKFDEMMAEVDRMGKDIERLELAMEAEARMSAVTPRRAGREDTPSGGRSEEEEKLEMDAFKAYLRGGMTMMPANLREIAERSFGPIRGDAATAPGSAGGYTVPQAFVSTLEQAMLAFGGMRQVADRLPTATGAPMPYPTENDTSNEGELVAENQAVTTQDITFGQVNFGAFMYSSKMVKVSRQLLQDTAFPFDTWLPARLGERLARITNRHFTVGTGAGSQPTGIVPASTQGKVGTTGQTTTVTTDDLIDLEHSVDVNYRNGAKFMFHDNVLRDIKKLKDTQGRYLWLPGAAFQQPDTILGYGYQVNMNMAVMAANAKSILFGALKKYVIRDVLDIQLLRLEERYAEALQVAFLAFMRADGNLVDAGTHPVKYYQNSAT